MIRLNDISIRNKLILMLVFTSVTVLGIFFVVFIVTDVRAYKARKADDMVTVAQVVASNSVSTLQFQDNDAAGEILRELLQVSPEIMQAVILDKKGNQFASQRRAGTDSTQALPGLSQRNYAFTGQRLFVEHGIVDNNEVLGRVLLEVRLTELQAIIRAKYELAIILLIAAIAFSFLIAVAVQTYISKRLLNLVGTLKDVGETGDYSKSITDDGKDELSVLIRGINSLMQQVSENQRRKDEFISIASHELKTPLTSVKGYLELLNEVEDRQPNKQFVAKGLDSVHKLEKLIRDLLDVSKIQSGQLELSMHEFNIDRLLDETIGAFQVVSKTHQIIREGHLDNATVVADRQRIEQVLANLLSNAIKYSPGESKVIVQCKRTDSELVIKVRDFGIGVPKEEQGRIFERFYRTKDISIHISGFGLGLYICRDIIKRHEGSIWVEAQDKGSAFYFSLPLRRISEPQPLVARPELFP